MGGGGQTEGEDHEYSVRAVTFSIFGTDEIKSVSTMEVNERTLYSAPGGVGGSDRRPSEHGVLDSRLGVSDRKLQCATCGGKLTECAGHFGMVRLEMPVYHVGYFKNVLTILQCVCKSCSTILVPEVEKKEFQKVLGNWNAEPAKRALCFKKLVERCKRVKVCPCCGALNGAVKKVPNQLKISHDKYYKDDKSKKEFINTTFAQAKRENEQLGQHLVKVVETLNCLRVWEIFKRIKPEDVELLNIKVKPEKLLMTHIPVPPVCIRPSIEMEMTSATNEDDITMKLIQIVEVNNNLRQSIEKGLAMTGMMEHWDFLQMQCAMYINSEAPGLPPVYHPHTKPLRGFVQRLKGKQGRFRGNLSGKRVDFSGRTVITPDPNLSIDEVAIPENVAKSLTYPDRVTRYNIKKLRDAILNGIEKHPGASFVIKKNSSKTYLKYGLRERIADGLQVGDVVERHLVDGDIVLFNRQPSLHKMSIMAHRVRVMPWRTFRFNECVCPPYNADFDGDEMNLHVPQTERARTEALVLMSVAQNLMSPKSGELIVSAIQDFLTCAHLVTVKDVFFDRVEFTRLACFICDASTSMELPPPAILKPVELWSGKQLFSMIIREALISYVKINLQLAEKIYSKRNECMCAVDGWVCVRDSNLLCGNLGKATLGTGSKEGLFALLVRDYNALIAMQCMNRLAKLSARWLGMFGFSIGISDVTPGKSLLVGKEDTVRKQYAKCERHIDLYNKGELELEAGCNDSETLEVRVSSELNKIREQAGKMCIQELHRKNSALIMAQCGAKGSPLNISQMVACVGQQNVNGKRIPEGFRDRTLPHFEKHMKSPNAKGFVKSSFFSGMSPTEFFFHTMAGREGLVDTAVKTAETGYMSRRLMKALEDLATRYDNTVRTCNGVVIQFTYGDDSLDPVEVEDKDGSPVNFGRILDLVRTRIPSTAEGSLLPREIRSEIVRASEAAKPANMGERAACAGDIPSAFEHWMRNKMHKFIFDQADKVEKLRKTWKLPLNKKVDDKENGKEYLLSIDGLSKSQIEEFVRTCFSKYEKERVEPGTAVGAVAAHSIGEPGTQMTLKTFHFAGVASMNVTLGVPRLKEIINASKTVSTPIMRVRLDDCKSYHTARIVKSRLERTTLGEVSSSISSVLGPSGAYILIQLDTALIRKLELKLDAEKICSILETATKLKIKRKHVEISSRSKLRVYPPQDESKGGANKKNTLFLMHSLVKELPQVIVKGIPAIQRAVINKEKSGEHYLVVEGLNLKEVMGIEGVDFKRTDSNHVMEVEKTLGIEAARESIINEIVYTMSEHGITVDRRHVMLLADLMTNKGEVLGITRFGIAKMKESVLMLASFEKTTDHLFNAALQGRKDAITGVSESIIMGKPMPIGTGHDMTLLCE